MTHRDFRCCIVLAALSTAAFAANQTDAFYTVIRANDLSGLAQLIETKSPNQADSRGITPLMYSATVGSAGAMRTLIDHGADVNARNAFGSTALMWSATDLEKIRLLVEHRRCQRRLQGRTHSAAGGRAQQRLRGNRPLPDRPRGRCQSHRLHLWKRAVRRNPGQ